MNYQYHTKLYHISHCYKAAFSIGKPLFEMCWFYMGIAQIALDRPRLPSFKRANVEEKVPQTILASPPLTGNAHMETTHFKKGLPFSYLCCKLNHQSV